MKKQKAERSRRQERERKAAKAAAAKVKADRTPAENSWRADRKANKVLREWLTDGTRRRWSLAATVAAGEAARALAASERVTDESPLRRESMAADAKAASAARAFDRAKTANKPEWPTADYLKGHPANKPEWGAIWPSGDSFYRAPTPVQTAAAAPSKPKEGLLDAPWRGPAPSTLKAAAERVKAAEQNLLALERTVRVPTDRRAWRWEPASGTKVNSYRVVYRYPDDDTEYAARVDETSPEAAMRALMSPDVIIIVRVENV